MNYLRTGMLLAGLTALFMAVGYLIGGPDGMLIALIVAVAMNLFSYWSPIHWYCRCTGLKRSMIARRPSSLVSCASSPLAPAYRCRASI